MKYDFLIKKIKDLQNLKCTKNLNKNYEKFHFLSDNDLIEKLNSYKKLDICLSNIIPCN